MMPTLKITSESSGERLDVVLARTYPKYSRSFLQKVVKQGGVRRQGVISSISERVHAGDIYDVTDFSEPLIRPLSLVKDHRKQADGLPHPEIIFEDDSLLVLNKPAGLVVHPAKGHWGSTLIDWLRDHLGTGISSQFLDSDRLGLVHRLDKDTSGVLLVAKSVVAQTALSRQFRDRTIRKTYSAFVEGILSSAEGVISAPVARSRKNPTRMAVSNYGRPSETSFQVQEVYKEASVSQVTLFPKTGRTHQLRVHMAAIGHPIVGDISYGSKELWGEAYHVQRSLLHAEKVELVHPATEKKVSYQAPQPADFIQARKLFRKGLALIGVSVLLGRAWSDLRADPSAAAPAASGAPSATTTHTHHSASSSSSSSSASAVRALKKETASLREDVSGLKDQLAAIKQQLDQLQSNYEQLSAGSRLADLEHAVSQLNAKAVGGNNDVEEAKTQMMDNSRKVKELSDSYAQMRDQLDRLRQALNILRTKRDAVPENPAAPVPSPSTSQGPK